VKPVLSFAWMTHSRACLFGRDEVPHLPGRQSAVDELVISGQLAGSRGQDEIHHRACTARVNPGTIGWDIYVKAEQHVIIGEWSLAVNHDQLLDVTQQQTRRELARLFKEQLHAFGATPNLRGAFFWTLRMGSGWDPRPTADFPRGRQLDGSSAWRSLPSYPFAVWSLLEMAAAGVASPLNGSYDVCG